MNGEEFQIKTHADFFVFHSPFARLTRKAYARLRYLDYIQSPHSPEFAALQAAEISVEPASFQDKQLERTFLSFSAQEYEEKVSPSTLSSRRIGNLATGSLWAGLLSLLSHISSSPLPLNRRFRVVLFSYGSGASSSMFSITFTSPLSPDHFPSFLDRLDSRIRVNANDFFDYFDRKMNLSEKPLVTLDEEAGNSYQVSYRFPQPDTLSNGCYYLHHIDSSRRRFYEKCEWSNVEKEN